MLIILDRNISMSLSYICSSYPLWESWQWPDGQHTGQHTVASAVITAPPRAPRLHRCRHCRFYQSWSRLTDRERDGQMEWLTDGQTVRWVCTVILFPFWDTIRESVFIRIWCVSFFFLWKEDLKSGEKKERKTTTEEHGLSRKTLSTTKILSYSRWRKKMKKNNASTWKSSERIFAPSENIMGTWWVKREEKG